MKIGTNTQEWCLQILSNSQTTVVCWNFCWSICGLQIFSNSQTTVHLLLLALKNNVYKYFNPPNCSCLVNGYRKAKYSYVVKWQQVHLLYTCNLGVTVYYNNCGFGFCKQHSPILVVFNIPSVKITTAHWSASILTAHQLVVAYGLQSLVCYMMHETHHAVCLGSCN